MSRKFEPNDRQRRRIVHLYRDQRWSFAKLAREFRANSHRIRAILEEEGVELRQENRGGWERKHG